MQHHSQIIRWLFIFTFLTLAFFACADPTEIAVPVITQPSPMPTEKIVAPTEVPPPPETLVVCMGREPASLFIYGDIQPEADTILQAIYDGPLDVQSFSYNPVILTKLPTLEDGDGHIEEVVVTAGDVYLNPVTQFPDTLIAQKPYLPSGCHQTDCMQTFIEGEAIMDQIIAEFELLPGLFWSDGEPLKSSDSVYSFHVDADETIPTTKYLVHRTTSYVALDERRVQWTGIPGFMDPEFKSNFWSPLPEHILGSYQPAELPAAEAASRFPIGWGPYEIVSWEPGSEIVMKKSETYFRSAEGLPDFDLVRFRFLGLDYLSALEQTLTGECDILDESVFHPSQWENAKDLLQEERLELTSTPGMVMERIDFNLSRASHSPATVYLSDVRTRQAIVACIDRQGLAEAASTGFSSVVNSYLPTMHPLYASGSDAFSMSTSDAIAQLEQVGWQDHDQDPSTARVAQGILAVVNGTPLELSFLTTDDATHKIIAENLKADLAQCGVGLEVEYGNPDEIFAPWPNGPIFGGRFDLVGWAWPIFVSPPCEMFAGFEVPSVDYVFGINASGFQDHDYDQACRRILLGPAYGDDYLSAVQKTQEILQTEVPVIPLYMRPRAITFGRELCGFDLNPTTYSALWNLELIMRGDDCLD